MKFKTKIGVVKLTALLFYRYFAKIENGKYIVAVVNKLEKQVKTAYLSHRIKIGSKYED